MPINKNHVPTVGFDPTDEDSWFFGYMSRKDATDLLSAGNDVGAFLVRESTTAKGDLVLSVKENNDKISHYIINKISSKKSQQVRFKIGEHIFADIPLLLAFYKSNNLDDTPLKLPAVSKIPFIRKRSFTRNYLAEIHQVTDSTPIENENSPSQEHVASPALHRKLPSVAKVIQARIPNAYDKTALTLKVGQYVTVTRTDISGRWEGECDGRTGHFPFNYVQFIEQE